MNKKTKELKEKFSLNEVKTLEEAIIILPEISTSKFDGSIEMDILLNLKESQKKESLRGSVSLPHQVGNDKKVIAFCESKDEKKAKDAGAVDAGLDELIEKVEKGSVEFDVVVATPAAMGKIVKLGKVLGPRGLMPNPKNGTISEDVTEMVKSFKSGKTSFRMTPEQGTIRGKVASTAMKPEEIKANILAYTKAVFAEAKKFGAQPFKKIILAPTMGPSVKLDVNDIITLV